MVKLRIGTRLLAGLMLISGASAYGAPTASQMLAFQPKQQGIAITTPGEAEVPLCKVELIKGTKATSGKTPSGWLLRDGRNQPVRCFLDTDGDNQIDIWSYYFDGSECYREIDGNFNQKADEYRWLGANGSKWGMDLNEDGKIDNWKAISPEEVSQEVMQAVITRDYPRLQALMITGPELTSLNLPTQEDARIRDSVTAAQQKFNKTTAALIGLSPKTVWMHVELGAPQTVAADALGAKTDLVKHKYGTILYENAGKHDWLQTGELIQVGRAWRIVDGPVPGTRIETIANDNGSGAVVPVSEETKPLLEELKVVDASSPKTGEPAAVAKYYAARAAVLEKVVGAVKPVEREPWMKQLADALAASAEAGGVAGGSSYTRLTGLKTQLAKDAPGSNVAAYVAYRELSADYSMQLNNTKDGGEMSKVQAARKDRLKKFVDEFPTSDDAADAYMQLGMVNEFVGNETEAKNWYGQVVKNFGKTALANKAAGAIRRIGLEGTPLELAGPTLGAGTSFDVAKLKDKVVVVYYWASWNTQSAADFAKIKTMLNTYGPKGLELVAVNLDNESNAAQNFVAQHSVPGTHLHSPGGLDSQLATQYGIFVLPNMFLVGKEGKVISRSVQLATLEDELKKAFGN